MATTTDLDNATPLMAGSSAPQADDLDEDHQSNRSHHISGPTPSVIDSYSSGVSSTALSQQGSASADLSRTNSHTLPPASSEKARGHLDSKRSHHLWPTAVVLALALVGIFVWAAFILKAKTWVNFDDPAIGGKMSQPKAKTVDFVWSFFFSPPIFWVLDYFWFRSARAAMFNETAARGVPLSTLTEATSTDAGSYNVLKIFKLVRRFSRKTLLFSTLVLSSGIALSTLSNVIAYEAFTEGTKDTTVRLNALNGTSSFSQLQQEYSANVTENIANHAILSFQERQLTMQIGAMLTSLTYQNANSSLVNATYLGVNATSASLNALPTNIVTLDQVPGYKLTIDCHAQPPMPDSGFWVLQMGLFADITVKFNDSVLYHARFLGSTGDLGNEDVGSFSFSAFSAGGPGGDGVYLGRADRFNQSHGPTSYGNLTSNPYKMLDPEFQGTMQFLSVSGFRCKVSRERGSHRLVRRKDLSWDIDKDRSTWKGQREAIPLLIRKFQDDDSTLHFRAPPRSYPGGAWNSYVPGLGPVFWASTSRPSLDRNVAAPVLDYALVPLNFLYAAGEAERIIQEVCSMNRSGPVESFEVHAVELDLFYRITYVPALLLVSLICILVAAAVSVWLAVSDWVSPSYRGGRNLDPLRLLIDIVDGLGDDADVKDMSGATEHELSKWAKRFRVKYSKGDGQSQVTLIRASGRI